MADRDNQDDPVPDSVEDNIVARSAGDRLRLTREQRDISLDAIAKSTRIPYRHLVSLEKSDFQALPGRTYALGFAKNYARELGLSENEIAEQLRGEMAAEGWTRYNPELSDYEPIETTSIPPKMLAWAAAGVAAILLIAYLVWRAMAVEPSEVAELIEEPAAQAPGKQASGGQEPAAQDRSAQPAPAAQGPVVFTATAPVWLRIYEDNEGERLFEGQLGEGESFTLPDDATAPQILTGRPDVITITVGGQTIPPLGDGTRSIADVPVDAAALLQHGRTGNSGDRNDSEDSET